MAQPALAQPGGAEPDPKPKRRKKSPTPEQVAAAEAKKQQKALEKEERAQQAKVEREAKAAAKAAEKEERWVGATPFGARFVYIVVAVKPRTICIHVCEKSSCIHCVFRGCRK